MLPITRQDLFFAKSPLKIAGKTIEESTDIVVQKLQYIINDFATFINSDAWKEPYIKYITLTLINNNLGHDFQLASTLQQHLLTAINTFDTCWIGTGTPTVAGYLNINIGTYFNTQYQRRRAHTMMGHRITVSLLLSYLLGPHAAHKILFEKHIGHICNIRNCRNPLHLCVCSSTHNHSFRRGEKSNRVKVLKTAIRFSLPACKSIAQLDTIFPTSFVENVLCCT